MKNVQQNGCSTHKMPNVSAMPRNLNSLCFHIFSLVFVAGLCAAFFGLFARSFFLCGSLFPYAILYLPRKLIVISWLCRYSYNCCIFSHTYSILSSLSLSPGVFSYLYLCAVALLLFDHYEDFRYLDFGLWVFSALSRYFVIQFFSFITQHNMF